MAKRKKPAAERKALKLASLQSSADAVLIKKYAKFCYQKALMEKAKEKGVSLIAPMHSRRHNKVLRKSEAAIREWFHGLGPMKQRARLKIWAELGMEPEKPYTPEGAPGE